jgi:hypothetical protein
MPYTVAFVTMIVLSTSERRPSWAKVVCIVLTKGIVLTLVAEDKAEDNAEDKAEEAMISAGIEGIQSAGPSPAMMSTWPVLMFRNICVNGETTSF